MVCDGIVTVMGGIHISGTHGPHFRHIHAGRSVPVVKGDVESAYRKLSRVLGQNQVVRELRANERHEKVGVKRRRLRSERWRRRFAHEVRIIIPLAFHIPQFYCL
jgi:ribosomal protein S21